MYRKSSIKLSLSNKPPFSEEELNKPPSPSFNPYSAQKN